MRRRRNADASSSSSDETTNEPVIESPTNPTSEIQSPPADIASAGGDTPKPRRRAAASRRTTPAADTAPAEPAGEPAAAVPAPDVSAEEATPAEAPKRRSAPRRRTAKAEAESDTASESSNVAAAPQPVLPLPEAEPAVEAPAEPAVEAVAEAPAPTAEAVAAEGDADATSKRSRRRRTPPRRSGVDMTAEDTSAAPLEPALAADADVPEAVASTGDAEEVAASAPTAKERPAPRERSGGKGRSSAKERPAPNSNTPESASPNAEPTDDRAGPKRTRGLRRRPTAGAQFVAAPTLVSDTDTENEASAEEAEETTDAEGTDKPKRIRGQRRRTPARVVGAAPAPAPTLTVAVPQLEPVPPPYQPLPQDVLSRLPETRIVVQKGVSQLVINGETRLPLWFFVNMEAAEDPEAGREVAIRQIRLAYGAGVRLFTLLAHLPWKTRSGERRYDILDSVLNLVAENAPDALVLPRLIFSPPASWERSHADEMTHYTDGEQGDVSLASRAFWEGEADDALRAAVEHVAQGAHAARVFGFYLEHGEWFHEKGRGYDISSANRAGFRSWLRQRYRNNRIALRAAWHDGSVTFETAEIPSWPPPPGTTVFFGPREQRWTDFHEYSSDIVAQVILRLGKAVKEASGGRSAVAVSYGYTLELPRAGAGHFALGQILASPDVDILMGPVSYSGRMPGGSATFPAPIDSVTLAGKLWVSEDDTKTHLAGENTPDTYNPRITTLEGTRAVQARNFGAALARGAGISWMDLWGEGWLDDREIWQGIAYLRELAQRNAVRRSEPATPAMPEPDVAVIVDERSFFGVRNDEFLLGHLVAQQRDPLLRSGARIGFYLQSDLAKPNFPQTPRLFLFLNAYRIPDNVRSAIRERFQNDGRTLVWLFAPGALEQSSVGDLAAGELSEVLGMQLRLQPWGSKTGTLVLSNLRSPLTDALRGQKFGEETRFNPTYYVSDTKAQGLAEYAATGNTSIGIRKHARWQSVFFGEPAALSVPLLRGLYRLAGVPTYTVDDDAAWIGDNLIALHSAPGGGTNVYLPDEGALLDLLTGETLASGGWGTRLSMPPRGTRVLFHGTATDITRFGGDPIAGPPGLTKEELPPAPASFVFEPSGTPPLLSRGAVPTPSRGNVNPEDAALFEAALEGEFPFEDGMDEPDGDDIVAAPADAIPSVIAETAEAAEARKKRRRRRRGRGRNREAGEAPTLDGLGEESAGGESLLDEDDEESDEDGLASPGSADIASSPVGLVFDVVSETMIAAPPGPTPRTRPSLEELLPQSDLPDGGELPPIPEEFLPLSDTDFALPESTEGAEDGETVTEDTARRSRRPRRAPRPRRGRRLDEGADAATPAAEGDAPPSSDAPETSAPEA